jgi:hypothetical protein
VEPKQGQAQKWAQNLVSCFWAMATSSQPSRSNAKAEKLDGILREIVALGRTSKFELERPAPGGWLDLGPFSEAFRLRKQG